MAARPQATPAEIASLADVLREIPGVEVVAIAGKRAQINATAAAAEQLSGRLGATFIVELSQARSTRV